MNSFRAVRSSSISRLSSSSEAPSSSAFIQIFLRSPQFALGIRQIAILDLHGDFPKQIGNALKRGSVAGIRQPPEGAAQAEIDRGFLGEDLRRDGEGVQRLDNAFLAVGSIDKALALFDQGPCQRLAEIALWKIDADRLAEPICPPWSCASSVTVTGSPAQKCDVRSR